jgi:hypothetical protein
MATRSNALFTVVRSPTTSMSVCSPRTCSAHALSLPLLQDTRVFIGLVMAMDLEPKACYRSLLAEVLSANTTSQGKPVRIRRGPRHCNRERRQASHWAQSPGRACRRMIREPGDLLGVF